MSRFEDLRIRSLKTPVGECDYKTVIFLHLETCISVIFDFISIPHVRLRIRGMLLLNLIIWNRNCILNSFRKRVRVSNSYSLIGYMLDLVVVRTLELLIEFGLEVSTAYILVHKFVETHVYECDVNIILYKYAYTSHVV